MAKRKTKKGETSSADEILGLLTPTQLQSLSDYRATVLQNPWIPWQPHPKQMTFLMLNRVREVLFGGAAGGGKSEALLMAAAQYVTHSGYAALILRRSFKELNKADALIPRSKEWWMNKATPEGMAKWNEQTHSWTFPSGATIEFGYIDNDNDIYQYFSSAFMFIGFDELTHFKEEQYLPLFARLRKHADSEVPLRMRAGTNPGGRGHEWVKKRFITAKPSPDRMFVPSLLKDNPTINADEYTKSMSNLPKVTRDQLLAGDWDSYEGGRFKREWFRSFITEQDAQGHWKYKWQIGVSPEGTPKFDEFGVHVSRCHNIIVCDPASRSEDVNDYTAIGVFALTPDHRILVLHVVREKMPLENIVPTIAKLCDEWEPLYVGVEDVSFQAAILNEARRFCLPDGRHPIPAVRGLSPEGKGKLVRATPAIVMAESGRVFVPDDHHEHKWIDDFVSELVVFTGDEREDAHDDQVDMFAYACQESKWAFGGGEVVQPEEGVVARTGASSFGGWSPSAVCVEGEDRGPLASEAWGGWRR